jgi:hypothetical protein
LHKQLQEEKIFSIDILKLKQEMLYMIKTLYHEVIKKQEASSYIAIAPSCQNLEKIVSINISISRQK